MKAWHCSDCDTDFTAERSTACLKCGSTDISCLGEIAVPGTPERHTGDESEKIRAFLRDLCRCAYESPWNGSEWDAAIDEAMSKLQPFLREKQRVY